MFPVNIRILFKCLPAFLEVFSFDARQKRDKSPFCTVLENHLRSESDRNHKRQKGDHVMIIKTMKEHHLQILCSLIGTDEKPWFCFSFTCPLETNVQYELRKNVILAMKLHVFTIS